MNNLFANLSVFERKFEGVIGSCLGVSEYMGDIVPRLDEDVVPDALKPSVKLGHPVPAHFHPGVVAMAVDEGRRELQLVARYDRRLESQDRPATEVEQRRIRLLTKAFYAHCSMLHVQLAMNAFYADCVARQAVVKEAV